MDGSWCWRVGPLGGLGEGGTRAPAFPQDVQRVQEGHR